MFKLLIIEDDNFKMETLIDLVKSSITNVNTQCVSDVASAISAVDQTKYDLIIIDMALPSHPTVSGEGSPMSLLTGGLEILFELRSLNRNDNCIIVTQYPEIEIAGEFYPVDKAALAIKQQFSCEVLACLQYSEELLSWKDHLSGLLKRYENSNS